MATEISGADPPLKLLSLDGGGIRGIASLIILKHLMKRLNPIGPPLKPCDFFDLIGGTSTGGIIAIMLGRLRMDVQTCIDKYIDLSSAAFTPKRSKANLLAKWKDKWEVNGAYRADILVREMRQAVEERLQDGDPEAKLFDPDPTCKVFVCAVTKARANPVRLRSYATLDSVDPLSGSECTIWQAARATSAAPTFFDPIQIGRQNFVDGATGMNNPVEQVLEEAKSIWPDAIQKGRIQCLVSIGTGVPNLKKFGDNLRQVVDTLARIATETERTEARFYNTHEFLGIGGRYFRFNVDRGLDDVELDGHEKIAEIEASAEEYLEAPRVKRLVGDFLATRAPVVALLDRGMKDRHLSWLNTIDALAQHTDARKYRTADLTTGQWFLDCPLEKWKRTAKSFVWLTGKAGSGKTVLSSAIIDKLEKESEGVVIYFYLSFRDEATQNLTAIKHSLLMQLVRHLVREDSTMKGLFHVPKIFQALFDKYSHTQYPLDEHVDATIAGLLGDSKQTFIVVDALDEFADQPLSAGNRRSVINFLEGLRRSSHGDTHVLVSSRRLPDIEAAVSEIEVPKTAVLMDTQAINADIKSFLMDSLRKHPFKDWPSRLKKVVAKTLTSKADGVFRWAALQLLALRDKDRHRDVETALETLPKDLEKTYEVVLTRIDNSGRSGMALSILQWLAYSQRPILLSEMSEIAIFEMQKCAPGPFEDYTVSFHPKDRFPAIWMARKVLSGLITVSGIDDQDEVPQDQDGAVSFSHFTVQEYLQGGNVSPWKFRLDQTAGHWYIMRSCLGYISCYDELYHNAHGHSTAQPDWATTAVSMQAASDPISDSDSEFEFSDSETADLEQVDYRPFPLLRYAAKYWWQHAIAFFNKEAEASLPDAARRVANATSGFQGEAFQYSIKMALTIADYDIRKDQSTRNGVVFAMGRLLSDEVSIETKDPENLQPVSAIIGCLTKCLSKDGSWTPQEKYAYDFDSAPALHHVAGWGDEVAVQLLLDAGANVNYGLLEGGRWGATSLHRAVRNNHKQVVEQLVEKGAELDLFDELGRTPLSWAAGEGYRNIAAYLVDKGAGLDIGDADEHMEVMLPEFFPDLRPPAVLFHRYRGVMELTRPGRTALHWAVAAKQQDTAILLVEGGADILKTELWGACPLSMVLVSGQEAVLRAMVEKDKEKCRSGRFDGGWTALHLAAAYRNLPMLRLLLSEGADISLRDHGKHCAALDMAAIGAYALGLQMMPIQESKHWKPEMGHAGDAIRLLLQHGCDLNPGEEVCSSPLHYAASGDQLEAVETLLESGANIDARNKFGWTPLMSAASNGSTATVRLMLSKGAEVNRISDAGLTALILASVSGFVETARVLLDAGADRSIERQEGKTAAIMAMEWSDYHVMRLRRGPVFDSLPEDDFVEINDWWKELSWTATEMAVGIYNANDDQATDSSG